MTRLTKDQRYTLITQITADLPAEIDYSDALRKRAEEICVGLMPALVKRVWDDPAARGFLQCGSYYHCCMSVPTPGFGAYDDQARLALRTDIKFKALHAAADAQQDARQKLRDTLKIGLAACTTHEQFRERFPALAKYLPEAVVAVANLPATTEVIDALKAAGLKGL